MSRDRVACVAPKPRLLEQLPELLLARDVSFGNKIEDCRLSACFHGFMARLREAFEALPRQVASLIAPR